MLEFFSSGVMALWLEVMGIRTPLLQPTQWLGSPEVPWMALPSDPDPQATAVLQQYLKELTARGINPGQQGIWLQSGSRILASHQGDVPLSAASLTKIATSLAALETWGPQHRFETLVSATGPIQGGVLQGDLVIQGSADPFFVWEEAVALGNMLNRLGIQRVTGNLIITGPFYMNYETNPTVAGNFLKEGINAAVWSAEAKAQHAGLPAGTPRPQVAIAGTVRVANLPIPQQILLVRHQSLPLAQLLKLMNIYSNNPMSEMLADAVGGAGVVRQRAAKATGIPVSEIQLINGSGLGQENRISPRAASAMLIAIQRHLQPLATATNPDERVSIADLFPVAGRDRGTLTARRIPNHSVVKTGTLWDVSALAGVIPTRDQGLIWFTIINRGTDLDGLRDRQDILLQALIQQWGAAPTLPTAVTPHAAKSVKSQQIAVDSQSPSAQGGNTQVRKQTVADLPSNSSNSGSNARPR